MKRFCLILVSVLSVNIFGARASAIEISGIAAKAYILMDARTGEVLASKNEDVKLPVASLTKIISILIALETKDLDKEFTVDSEAVKEEGSSMGLKEGDIVTMRDLCYGMALPSGNDAANAAAVRIAGDIESFAKLMNARAKRIGMKSTKFVTPSGLHRANHYSTAYDFALLTREALKNKDFAKICKTQSINLKFGNPPYDRRLKNSNKLLALYPGCIGVKTGFTDEAGRCLVSAAEKDGVKLICVTLNDPDDWNDHITLYDYGFSSTESQELEFEGKLTVKTVGGDKEEVALALSEKPVYTAVSGKFPQNVVAKVIIPRFVYAPVSVGDVIGYIEFSSGDEIILETPLISTEKSDVAAPKKKGVYYTVMDYLKNLP